MRRLLISVAFVVLATACGSEERQYRTPDGTCVETWRAWAIWQFDERTIPVSEKNCVVPR